MKYNNTIIFCHYGNSGYLYYTLKQVKITNPKSRIILLGDNNNLETAISAGVEHHFFIQYSNTEEIREFERVYKHIAGEKHGRIHWTKFVFQRWFYVHSFIKDHNITKFWHFDSDNMIFTDLQAQEKKFQNYDCTEQCNSKCMNGFISSFEVVDKYVKTINELFLDDEYLYKQKQDFIVNPEYAFTEMRAYLAFKEKEGISTVSLNSIIDNETFDDCICQEHGYRLYDTKFNNQYLKKLFIDKNRMFYCYHNASNSYIKMNSLNLSWVPDSLFIKIFKATSVSTASRFLAKFKSNKIVEFNIFE